MLFLSTKNKLGMDLVKTLLICLLLFNNTEISTLAPASRFNNYYSADQKIFLTETTMLFSALYVSLYSVNDPAEYKRIQKTLVQLDYILSQNGARLNLEKVEYVMSQPEVVYLVFRIDNDVRVIRVFDRGLERNVYPARVLREISFKGSGKVTQLITETSYNIIKLGEKKVVKKANGFRHNIDVGLFGLSCFVYSCLNFLSTSEYAANLLLKATSLSPIAIVTIVGAAFGYFVARKISPFLNRLLSGTGIKSKNAIPQPYSSGANYILAQMKAHALALQIKNVIDTQNEVALAIETDWMSEGYNKKRITEIIRVLRKKYKGRIKIIHSPGDKLFTELATGIGELKTSRKEVVIVAGRDAFQDEEFKWIMEKGFMFMAVDGSNIKRIAPTVHETKDRMLYVDFIEILETALKIALNRQNLEIYNPKLYYDPEINPNFAIFKPNPNILTIYEIDRIYNIQLRTLRSA